jgi:hypothetical protein
MIDDECAAAILKGPQMHDKLKSPRTPCVAEINS